MDREPPRPQRGAAEDPGEASEGRDKRRHSYEHGGPAAVLVDYASLYLKNRSAEEETSFKTALKDSSLWYSRIPG